MIDWQQRYCGPAPGPANWLTQWNGDPVLLTGLALASGWFVLRRTETPRHAGLMAVAVLAVAFVSPLCALTTALFAARAVHHLLLVTVVAPLLAVALPLRRDAGVTVPLIVSSAVLWAWHFPVLYDAALGHVAVYWAMQVGLVGTAWWFWRAVFSAGPVAALAGIVGGAVQMGFLGALLTFATRPLYTVHATTTVPFGIGPIADQQLAGLVMWVPGMVPYAVAAAWLVWRRWQAMAADTPMRTLRAA